MARLTNKQILGRHEDAVFYARHLAAEGKAKISIRAGSAACCLATALATRGAKRDEHVRQGLAWLKWCEEEANKSEDSKTETSR